MVTPNFFCRIGIDLGFALPGIEDRTFIPAGSLSNCYYIFVCNLRSKILDVLKFFGHRAINPVCRPASHHVHLANGKLEPCSVVAIESELLA